MRYLKPYSNQINGSIPLEIWNLANLEAIDPDSNNISGSIHSRVGSLTSLRYLDLSSNQINGSILYEIGNMENLKTLDLSSNNVHGSVPPMMCNLKALWILFAPALHVSCLPVHGKGRLVLCLEKWCWSCGIEVDENTVHALPYLHHDCNPSIVHRDISSNIALLNSESKSFVADPGVARLLIRQTRSGARIIY